MTTKTKSVVKTEVTAAQAKTAEKNAIKKFVKKQFGFVLSQLQFTSLEKVLEGESGGYSSRLTTGDLRGCVEKDLKNFKLIQDGDCCGMDCIETTTLGHEYLKVYNKLIS